MKKKKIENFTESEQKFINLYYKNKLFTEIENINIEELDDDTYTQLLIYVLLSIGKNISFRNSENLIYNIINGELIETQYIPQGKIYNTDIVKPNYIYERIEYQKNINVQGFDGVVTDWEERINGKKYSEYSENSYERKNWRTIEYDWKKYINEVNK